MYRYAYHLPGVGLMNAVAHPEMRRILRGWPNVPNTPDSVMVQEDTRGGVLAVWPRYDGASVSLDSFGVPRETTGGITYYPSKELPTKEDLIRPEVNRGQGLWVDIKLGGSVWVPLALASPRKLLMRVGKPVERGEFATEFGVLAHELYPHFVGSVGIEETDLRLARLLFLAEQQSYMRTEEMAEDDPWLTTSDILPVFLGIMGLDPKSSTAVPAGSASADPVTGTLI